MPRLTTLLCLTIALICFAAAPPASAQDKPATPAQGNWRFEKDAADAPSLSFTRDGKVIFLVRAGRTISVWFAWPEGPQTKGAVRVGIDTGKKRWRMDGDLTTEEQGGKPTVYQL